MAAICMACTTSEIEVSFPTVKQLMEHQKGGHVLQPEKKEPILTPTEAPKEQTKPEVIKVEPKPIILEYKYEGTHDSCGNQLDTIQVPVENHAIIVAYCSTCKAQVTEQKVIPIEKQPELFRPKYIINKDNGVGEIIPLSKKKK